VERNSGHSCELCGVRRNAKEVRSGMLENSVLDIHMLLLLIIIYYPTM
jgi:hypothetical protein